jgi:hypothetical protein
MICFLEQHPQVLVKLFFDSIKKQKYCRVNLSLSHSLNGFERTSIWCKFNPFLEKVD